jgi:hypothetical protein
LSYRLFRIARGDNTPKENNSTLSRFDEDINALINLSSLPKLLDDLSAVRNSTLTLLTGLTKELHLSTGYANNSVFSVRALAYLISGHELHHRKIINERYLPQLKQLS